MYHVCTAAPAILSQASIGHGRQGISLYARHSPSAMQRRGIGSVEFDQSRTTQAPAREKIKS